MSNEMIERAAKALALAVGNAPFYVMPQYRNKAIVYETMKPGCVDLAHSRLIGFEEAEILCEKLNNEWIIKQVIENLKLSELEQPIYGSATCRCFNSTLDAILSGE